MIWCVALEAKPWGDGSSPDGRVNLVCEEWQIVIAKDVSRDIADEICRLWNEVHAPTRVDPLSKSEKPQAPKEADNECRCRYAPRADRKTFA